MGLRPLLYCALLALLAACGAAPVAPPASPVAEAPATPAAPPATTAPATPASAVTLTVFAPAGLTEAVKQLAADFEKTHAGVRVELELGHSPAQREQLEQGATPDVFISASRKDMDAVAEKQLVVADQVRPFARNQLVVILPPDNPGKIETLADLARPGVQVLIAAADLPIGNATLTMLEKLNASIAPDFKERVLANVVSTELGVKPIVSKISLGEADAGVVYVSDAVAAPNLKTLEIPQEANVAVVFTIAPVTAAAHPEEAADFVALVLSPAGQNVLSAHGLLPAQP